MGALVVVTGGRGAMAKDWGGEVAAGEADPVAGSVTNELFLTYFLFCLGPFSDVDEREKKKKKVRKMEMKKEDDDGGGKRRNKLSGC